jgi:hypothetical protein
VREGPVVSRKTTRIVLVVAVVVALVGCSRGGDGDGSNVTPTAGPNEPQRTVRPGQHGPIAKGDYSFDGALELSGDYTVLYSFADEATRTCGRIAGDDATGYVVPLPTFKDERRFVWTAGIREYSGPGTYAIADLQGLKLQVLKNPDAEPVDYLASNGATAELKVTGKNSGSFEFEGLKNADGDEINGDVSWECTEGSEGEG